MTALLTRLPVPFRINCVLYKDYPEENLIPFIERFRKLPGANIQFRFDYTATTPENLYEPGGQDPARSEGDRRNTPVWTAAGCAAASTSTTRAWS